MVVAHDITARVRAERSAENAEAKFAHFMAAIPTIVDRTIICEITEHVAIEDYPALRGALDQPVGG